MKNSLDPAFEPGSSSILDPATTVVLCCTSLTDFLAAAQKRAHTALPVVYVDRNLHLDPSRMRQRILEALEGLPEDVSTVLIAMGYCGGSWEGVPCGRRRIVQPVASDCISLLLATDGQPVYERKDQTHLYIKDRDPLQGSFKSIFEDYTADKPEEVASEIYARWQELFRGVDILDAGVYDTKSEDYERRAAVDADFLQVPLAHVPGSILLLEKLVRGDWDEQFRVYGPGEAVGRPEGGPHVL